MGENSQKVAALQPVSLAGFLSGWIKHYFAHVYFIGSILKKS